MASALHAASENLSHHNQILVWVVLGVGVLSILFAFLFRSQASTAEGNQPATAGPGESLRERFTVPAVFAVVVCVLLVLLPGDTELKISRSVALLIGALGGGAMGLAGSQLASRAGSAVAVFRAGAALGVGAVGVALFGAAVAVLVFKGQAPSVLVGFGFGIALVAIFVRGVDLLAAYVVAMVAAVTLGSIAFGQEGLIFPLVVLAVGALAAVVGVFLVSRRSGETALAATNGAVFASALVSAFAGTAAAWFYLPTSWAQLTFAQSSNPNQLVASVYGNETLASHTGSTLLGFIQTGNPRGVAVLAVLIGIVLGSVVLAITGRFAARPARRSGGFESTAYVVLAIGAALVGAYVLGAGSLAVSLFAVALVGCGLLGTLGVLVAIDTVGASSSQTAEARAAAALAGSYGTAAAAVAATALFGLFGTVIKYAFSTVLEAIPFTDGQPAQGPLRDLAEQASSGSGALKPVLNGVVDVADPGVLAGLFVGASIVFLCAGLLAGSPRRAAVPAVAAVAVLAPIALGFGLGLGALGASVVGVIAATFVTVLLATHARADVDEAEGSVAVLGPVLVVTTLVALLVVPLVVRFSYGADTSAVVRYSVAGVAVAIIAGAVYFVKRPVAIVRAARAAELEPEPDQPEEAEAAPADEQVAAEEPAED